MNENTETPNATLPAAAIDVHLVGDTPKTTSLNVAEVFGKDHKNIIQAIERLDCPEEFSRLNFQPSDYIDERGKRQRMYEMTKDGATLLIMGFTGRQAMRFKVAYIEAFNRLESMARQGAGGAADGDWRALCEEYKVLLKEERTRFGHAQKAFTQQREELLDVYRRLYGAKH